MRITLQLLIVLFVVFVTLSLRPTPKPDLKNCMQKSGKIQKVMAGEGAGNIVLSLENDPACYYINRGQEKGFDLKKLKEKLENKTINLLISKHWTPLDPFGQFKHIIRLEFKGEILYDEIERPKTSKEI